MNLLVIGNGFDLAHHMPTRYSDFLDFMTLCVTNYFSYWRSFKDDLTIDMVKIRTGYSAILRELSRKTADNHKVTALFNDNQEKFKLLLSSVSLLDKFYKNSILRYCLYAYAYKKSFSREFNWIDIENELLELLTKLQPQKFDKDQLDKIFINSPRRNGTGNLVTEKFYIPTIADALKTKNVPPEFVRQEVFDHLFNELENFSLLLKFYLKLVRDDFNSAEAPKKIFKINANQGISVDSVLSFNYTDTAKMYAPEAPIYFVNGSLDAPKIILGVENPSQEQTADYANDNIHLFFKNVQRVLYDFHYDYTSTLRDYNKFFGIHVYIIGHSLAPSDRYILTDVMMRADTVTIYYHTEDDKYSKTANLYQILGDELFTKHVNNPEATPRIELVPQKSIMSAE